MTWLSVCNFVAHPVCVFLAHWCFFLVFSFVALRCMSAVLHVAIHVRTPAFEPSDTECWVNFADKKTSSLSEVVCGCCSHQLNASTCQEYRTWIRPWSFEFCRPTVWNTPSSALRDSNLKPNTFQRWLKTYTFRQW